MTVYPFAPWRPDQPALSQYATEAKNVIPKYPYAPLGSLSVVVDDALDGACRGAASVKSETGDVYTYAGTDSSLFNISGAAADVSDSSGYTGSEYSAWKFAQFGNYIIATNGVEAMQRATIGGLFSAMPNAPIAKYTAIVRDFVFAGYVNSNGHLIKWSGNNNTEQWTAAENSSGEQVLHESGVVTGLVGGEFALVFMEKGIIRGLFIGGDLVFQFDQIENQHGCDIPGSLVTYGKNSYYHSSAGFYVTDGNAVLPIGEGKIDQYFESDFDHSYPHRVSGSIDPVNNLVVWTYPGSGHSSGTPNKAIIYNYQTGEWARAVFDCQIVFPAYTLDTSLEAVSALFADLEAVTPSLDSPAWRGGVLFLGAFNTSNKLCDFSGANLEAIVSTGETQLLPGRTTFVGSVIPLVDTSSATVRAGRRDRLADSVSYTSASSMQTTVWPNERKRRLNSRSSK